MEEYLKKLVTSHQTLESFLDIIYYKIRVGQLKHLIVYGENIRSMGVN